MSRNNNARTKFIVIIAFFNRYQVVTICYWVDVFKSCLNYGKQSTILHVNSKTESLLFDIFILMEFLLLVHKS